jgi:hypothetical protein
MDWTQIAADFVWDGSLRDIYVLGTTEADWDNILARLRRFEPPPVFTVDNVVQAMPMQMAAVFSLRDKQQPMLTVMAGQAVLNCHFFGADNIEFDCDPRDITGPPQAEMLAGFMRLLGQATRKSVILCHENAQHLVIARCLPPEGEVVWVGTKGQ